MERSPRFRKSAFHAQFSPARAVNVELLTFRHGGVDSAMKAYRTYADASDRKAA